MSTREQPTRLAHARTRSHTFAHARTHWHALAKGLDYEEFRTAIKTFPGASNVNLTQEEYEIITDGGALLNEDGEFDSARFREMMQRELWRCAPALALRLLRTPLASTPLASTPLASAS